jgi:acetyl-CoA acetyltransferase
VCQHCLSDDLEWVVVSGNATVVGVTVNHQMFMPSFTPPYVVAVVAIDEAPEVRLTTNLIGLGDDAARIGMRVKVVFHEQDGVWFPLFTPTGEPDGDGTGIVPPPVVSGIRQPLSEDRFEHKVAITGIGYSAIGRRLMRPPVTLTVEACKQAIADAGLELSDIDGLATWPGSIGGGGGITEGGISVVQEALGVHPTWHSGGIETSGQTGSIVNAMLAVASGLCRHVLCFRTVWEATNTELLRTGGLPLPRGGTLGGDFQWRIPYGASSAANWVAMQASQYFAKYGADREMLASIALNARAHAALNPRAVYRDPLTRDDYMSARAVSTPLGLYDCDVPCDGSIAIVISARETAANLRQPPVYIDAVGTQVTERNSWDQGTMTHLPNTFGAGSHLWTRASVSRADLDVAQLYDGFSFNCVTWIESLGLCGVGEAKDWLEGGKRIGLDGELPLNTHGGQLSGGRTHGYGFVAEAVEQLRGHAEDRQVPNAQVALVAAGGGMPGGAFILTNR